jgi:large subunit ribosomal protein L22
MGYNYSTKRYDKENMAKVVGRSLPISTKFCVEICNFIRYKTTSEAKRILQEVIEGKRAIPFKIFKRDLSHKRKIGAGRYPKKAADEIMKLLESVEANAQFKGLNTSNLRIAHINAHLASRPWRYGRQRRRKAKRTHIEIIVEENKTKESKEETKKEKKIRKREEKAPEVEKKATKASKEGKKEGKK